MQKIFTISGSLFALATIGLYGGPASALKVDPLVVQLASRGDGAAHTYEITNDTDKPSSISLAATHRQMNADGVEKLSPAGKEFRLSASTFVLQPGERKQVELRWLGSAKPKAELAYRLIVEQHPIGVAPAGNAASQVKVNVIVRVQAAVYVAPPQVSSKVSVTNSKPVMKKGAPPQLLVTLKNSGTAHATLDAPTLTLKTKDGKSLTLKTEDLNSMATQTVLAGHQRHFLIPWPAGLPAGPVTTVLTQG